MVTLYQPTMYKQGHDLTWYCTANMLKEQGWIAFKKMIMLTMIMVIFFGSKLTAALKFYLKPWHTVNRNQTLALWMNVCSDRHHNGVLLQQDKILACFMFISKYVLRLCQYCISSIVYSCFLPLAFTLRYYFSSYIYHFSSWLKLETCNYHLQWVTTLYRENISYNQALI